MTWAAFRLQRTEMFVVAGIVAAVAALLVPTGIHIASVYSHDGIAACSTTDSPSCGNFLQQFHGLVGLLGWFNLVPGLVGVLLAAPLLLELENGTFRFAWTQGVTRGRWIAGKIGVAVGVALLAALGFSQLLTWWRGPFDHLTGRMEQGTFDFEGTVDYAYVVFALALALVIGVLVRRAVAALVVGFAAYVVSRVFVDSWLRQRLDTPLSATWPATSPGPNLNHAWVLMEGPSNRFGNFAAPSFAASHVSVSPGVFPPPEQGQFVHAVYQPASRFWALQGIETALFGGIAVALILFVAWWIKERVA